MCSSVAEYSPPSLRRASQHPSPRGSDSNEPTFGNDPQIHPVHQSGGPGNKFLEESHPLQLQSEFAAPVMGRTAPAQLPKMPLAVRPFVIAS